MLTVKVLTHDVIVHSQTASIEKLLGRSVNFQITLNTREARSNIQFEANAEEVDKIRYELGYTILTRNGGHWVPVM